VLPVGRIVDFGCPKTLSAAERQAYESGNRVEVGYDLQRYPADN